MRKLTEDEYFDLEQAYEEAMDDVTGLGGKHALLLVELSKLGYYPNSWQEAVKMAEELLWEGY